MAEAHEPLAARESVAHPLLGVLRGTHLGQLVDHLGGGASMEWALHRADGARHGRRDVRAGGGDDPCGERGGVEPVLGTDDEVRVEGANRAVIGTVAAQLVEEAFDQVKRRVGIDRFLSGAQPGERGQR